VKKELWVERARADQPVIGHVITADQIDAAWKTAFNPLTNECCEKEMQRLFAQLGIKRCERCDPKVGVDPKVGKCPERTRHPRHQTVEGAWWEYCSGIKSK
jgi:hypothetical protein